MKTEKEKQLEIQLLTEKIQRISGKKVVLKENEATNNIKDILIVAEKLKAIIESAKIIGGPISKDIIQLAVGADKKLNDFWNKITV